MKSTTLIVLYAAVLTTALPQFASPVKSSENHPQGHSFPSNSNRNTAQHKSEHVSALPSNKNVGGTPPKQIAHHPDAVARNPGNAVGSSGNKFSQPQPHNQVQSGSQTRPRPDLMNLQQSAHQMPQQHNQVPSGVQTKPRPNLMNSQQSAQQMPQAAVNNKKPANTMNLSPNQASANQQQNQAQGPQSQGSFGLPGRYAANHRDTTMGEQQRTYKGERGHDLVSPQSSNQAQEMPAASSGGAGEKADTGKNPPLQTPGYIPQAWVGGPSRDLQPPFEDQDQSRQPNGLQNEQQAQQGPNGNHQPASHLEPSFGNSGPSRQQNGPQNMAGVVNEPAQHLTPPPPENPGQSYQHQDWGQQPSGSQNEQQQQPYSAGSFTPQAQQQDPTPWLTPPPENPSQAYQQQGWGQQQGREHPYGSQYDQQPPSGSSWGQQQGQGQQQGWGQRPHESQNWQQQPYTGNSQPQYQDDEGSQFQRYPQNPGQFQPYAPQQQQDQHQSWHPFADNGWRDHLGHQDSDDWDVYSFEVRK